MIKISNYINIIKNNIDEVRDYLINNIDDVKIQNSDKVLINCPWCDSDRHRHKLIINIDWSNFKCYRCNESGNLFKLLKEYNLYDDFILFLSTLSNYSLIEIKNEINKDISNELVKEETKSEYEIKLKKYISENNLVSINTNKIAYNYALSRTFNNKELVKSCLIDNNYVYFPIKYQNKIVSYMGRLFTDNEKLSRYNMKYFDRTKPLIGLFDDLIYNLNNDSIYITEGYFDSIAINYALSNSTAITSFGKTNYKKIITQLAKFIPSDYKIYIVFDSIKKDNEIYKDNIEAGKYISNYFDEVYIVELENYDCFDIANNSTIELKRQLENNITSLFKYQIKYSI